MGERSREYGNRWGIDAGTGLSRGRGWCDFGAWIACRRRDPNGSGRREEAPAGGDLGESGRVGGKSGRLRVMDRLAQEGGARNCAETTAPTRYGCGFRSSVSGTVGNRFVGSAYGSA